MARPVAPKGTPKPVVDRLNAALKVALKDPTLKQRFADLGTEPVADSLATPEALQAHLKAQTAVWAPIIKKAGRLRRLTSASEMLNSKGRGRPAFLSDAAVERARLLNERMEILTSGELLLNSLIRSPKDFYAAVIYMVIGVSTIVIGRDYADGHGVQDGARLLSHRPRGAALLHWIDLLDPLIRSQGRAPSPRSPGSRCC